MQLHIRTQKPASRSRFVSPHTAFTVLSVAIYTSSQTEGSGFAFMYRTELEHLRHRGALLERLDVLRSHLSADARRIGMTFTPYDNPNDLLTIDWLWPVAGVEAIRPSGC